MVSNSIQSGQSDRSIEKNRSFFKDNLAHYDSNIKELDTYSTIRKYLSESLQGIDRLLDIGNGGVFDYDTTVVKNIVALDLFLDELDPSLSYPNNVELKNGSALSIPEPDESFDGVLLSMLLHHLTGKTVEESFENVRLAVREAFRVLQRGGKMIVLESCVPPWFFLFERLVFPLAPRLMDAMISHPATLQYPADVLGNVLRELGSRTVEMLRIPKGKWIMLLGFRYPAKFVPIHVYQFVIYK